MNDLSTKINQVFLQPSCGCGMIKNLPLRSQKSELPRSCEKSRSIRLAQLLHVHVPAFEGCSAGPRPHHPREYQGCAGRPGLFKYARRIVQNLKSETDTER